MTLAGGPDWLARQLLKRVPCLGQPGPDPGLQNRGVCDLFAWGPLASGRFRLYAGLCVDDGSPLHDHARWSRLPAGAIRSDCEAPCIRQHLVRTWPSASFGQCLGFPSV